MKKNLLPLLLVTSLLFSSIPLQAEELEYQCKDPTLANTLAFLKQKINTAFDQYGEAKDKKEDYEASKLWLLAYFYTFNSRNEPAIPKPNNAYFSSNGLYSEEELLSLSPSRIASTIKAEYAKRAEKDENRKKLFDGILAESKADAQKWSLGKTLGYAKAKEAGTNISVLAEDASVRLQQYKRAFSLYNTVLKICRIHDIAYAEGYDKGKQDGSKVASKKRKAVRELATEHEAPAVSNGY